MIIPLVKIISNITRPLVYSALLLVVLSVLLIQASSYVIWLSFMNRVKNSTTRDIQSVALSLLHSNDFSSADPFRTDSVFTSLFQQIKTTEIVRIKVWDRSARIIYSDDSSVVGKIYSDDQELQQALKGTAITKVETPDSEENLTEKNYPQVLEVYIPIIFEGNTQPAGVIEVYFMLDNINHQISETNKILIISIVMYASLSYLLINVLLTLGILKQTSFLRKVIDTNPGLIFVKDWNGKFILVNKATADIYNTSVENLVGKTDSDFNPNKEEIKQFLIADRHVMESGVPSQIIEEPVTNVKTGEQRWFQTVKVPLNSGRVRQVLGISTEITERKKQEEQMRLQTAALIAAENGIFITDINGIIKWINPAFTHLTGYTTEDVVGKTPRVLKSGLQSKEYYSQLWGTILSGKPWCSELVNRRKDGALLTIEQTIAPVLDDKGAITHFVAIQHDISERKLATQKLGKSQKAIINVLDDLRIEKAKDEAMLASIGEGLIAVDNEKKIVVMNNVAEKILGWNSNEFIGKVITNLPLYDEAGQPIPVEKRPTTIALMTGEVVKTTHFFVKKDKTRFPIAITATPIRLDGKIIGLIEIIRDITREMDIDRAKSEFVSLASHQLRTPLSTINWYTEMLLSEDAGVLADKQRKYLDEVYRGSKRMVELVNSLLNVSRIEMDAFGIEPEEIRIKDVVNNVLEDLAIEIQKNNLHLDVSYDDVDKLVADAKLLRLIFQNILGNAIRYTPKKGSITFSVRKNASDILFSVRDTGIGIPKIAQPKIFTKLFRADNARMVQSGGTGLGLYLVKNILDHAGGRIWFESEEGKGSTFYVTIPLTGMKKKEWVKSLA